MPGDGLARGPPAKRKAGGSHHRFSRIPGIPCAMVLTGSCSPQGPGFLAPVASRSLCSLSISVGMPGPHDFAVRADDARLASSRVHRSPASRVVTIAIRPQHRGGMAREDHVFLQNGSRIILARGLDSRISIESPSEFRFFAHGISAYDDGVSRDQNGPHGPVG
jgi:hypothetical protein